MAVEALGVAQAGENAASAGDPRPADPERSGGEQSVASPRRPPETA